MLEVRATQVLRAAGVEAPERQIAISALGDSYRVDLGWRHRRVLLECHGRDPHDDPAAFARDFDRLSAIAAVTGHSILVTTWNETVRTPERLVAKVLTAFETRGACAQSENAF